jgi:MYXO-CTERM domain-containing protein
VTGLNGSRDLIKWGNGTLWVGGNNTSFTGNVSIEQGAIGVTHANAFTAAGTLTARRYGVLDILTTGFTKAVTYEAGSIERWSVDNARSGIINLGAGSLQVNADQNTTNATIQLNGGAIEGFLRTDDPTSGNSGVVFRTLGNGVSVQLLGNSFIGQNAFTDGPNGTDNGRTQDAFTGSGPDGNSSSELTASARGAILEIKGNISGTGGLTKQGTDTVILSGNNTYTGSTSVANGTLRLGSTRALPTASNVTTSGRGVLDLAGNNVSVRQLSAVNYSTSSAFVSNGGFITNSSTVQSLLTVGTGSTANFSYGGVIQNNIALTKMGSHTLTLTNVNTHIGGTVIRGGGLTLRDGGRLSAAVTVSGLSSTLTLDDTGLFTSTALGVNRLASALTLQGGTLNYIGIQSSATVSPVSIAPGGSTITVTPTGSVAPSTLTVANLARSSGATLNFTGTNLGAGGAAANSQIILSPAPTVTNGIIGGWATVGGTDFASYVTPSGTSLGVGALGTAGYPAYSANALTDGTATDNIDLTTASTTGVGTRTINSLRVNTAAATTIDIGTGNTLTLASGGLIMASNQTLAISGGSLTSGGSELFAYINANTTTISSAITGSGVNLVKSGSGTLTLTGTSNTYTGGTTLNAGTLNISNANAIGTGPLTINGGVLDNTSGAAMNLPNNPLIINGDFTFAGTHDLNLGNGTVTLNANRIITLNGGVLTIGGSITGAFGLSGTGPGILLLNGASNYTGTTNVQTGSTLGVGVNGSLGDTSSGTVVVPGASIQLFGVNYTDPEPLNITGAGTGAGGAALLASGTSSFAGPITLDGNATIGITPGGTFTLSGPITKDGTVLTLGGGGTFNITGSIGGTSPNSDLLVDATTVNLNSANTYNGPTFIQNAGVLNANVNNALPTTNGRTAIVMNNTAGNQLNLGASQTVASLEGGTNDTVNLGSNTLNVGEVSGSTIFGGSITGTGGSLSKDRASTLVLSGANTYSGGTTVSVGTLEVNNTSGSGTGSGSVTLSGSGQLTGSGSIAGSTILGGSSILAPGQGNAATDNRTLTFTAASSTALQVANGAQIQLGISSPTNNSLLTYAGGKFLYNGSEYTTALSLFNAESAARTTWNTAPANAANHDFIRLTGTGSNLVVNGSIVVQNNGFTTPAYGQVFNLIDWTQVSGSDPVTMDFAGGNLNLPDLSASGFGWDSTAFTTYGIVVVTPEPSRALFLMLGLLGLLMRRRRKV